MQKHWVSFAFIDKRRPKDNQSVVANLIGDLVDKNVLIIDDMIDTAGTICNAAESAIENGAKSVMAIATHELSGPAVERLSNSSISKVMVCNTIDISQLGYFPKIRSYKYCRSFWRIN